MFDADLIKAWGKPPDVRRDGQGEHPFVAGLLDARQGREIDVAGLDLGQQEAPQPRLGLQVDFSRREQRTAGFEALLQGLIDVHARAILQVALALEDGFRDLISLPIIFQIVDD
jgi:hypothetical protein